MGHSRIFQITNEKIEDREDFITSDWYEPEFYSHYADYIDETKDEDDSLKWLDREFYGLFERNGRELTLLNIDGFMKDFKNEIVKAAERLDMHDWATCYVLRKMMRQSQKSCDFYINAEIYCCSPMTFGNWIQYIYQNHKPGDKFYIGGILDYHY